MGHEPDPGGSPAAPASSAAGAGSAADAGGAGGEGSAATAGNAANAEGAAQRGRWEGEVSGGYTGNGLSFTVSPEGSQIQDITFDGHWDCSDGIETATLGPEGSFPIQADSVNLTSVDPPDGGSTAMRFVFRGHFAGARAEGTLRGNLNALGCDTGELRWTAAPAEGS